MLKFKERIDLCETKCVIEAIKELKEYYTDYEVPEDIALSMAIHEVKRGLKTTRRGTKQWQNLRR